MRIDRAGVRWSLAGFAVVGISGLLLNLIINNRYGSTILGQFNVLLAVFIIGGQVGSMGIQASVLFHTPRARSLGRPTRQVLVSALKLNVASSSLCVVVVIGGGELILRAAGNEVYRSGLHAIAIGLFLFPINKLFLAHLNGLRRIRLFSIIFALRYVLLVVIVGALAAAGVSGSALPWAVSGAESVLVVVLVVVLRDEFRNADAAPDLPAEAGLTGRLFRFGVRGMTGGLLLDLNTRVDILILGAIAGSNAVGQYSIASLFAEGLYQLAMVSRYSLDPLVAHLFVERRMDELRTLVRSAKRRVYMFVGPIGVATVLLYAPVIRVLFGDDLAGETWPIYAPLALGVVASAGYIPFMNVLQQTGRPTLQSFFLGWISATNIVLNLALVPFFGAVGSAFGTAMAQVALVPYLRHLSRRRLGFAL
jgi:O-antigen/teichoic acid export membrane protein